MELINRKLLISLSIVVMSISLQAQVSPTQIFSDSYQHEASGDYYKAINELNKLVGFNYHKFLRLGWLHYLAKDYEVSKRYYKQAVEFVPKAIEPLLGLCYPLEMQAKTDELEVVYKKILAIDSKNSKINYNLGSLYYYRKDFVNAEKHFDVVRSLYPSDYYSTLMAAWTKYFLNKKNEAKQLFNLIVTIFPNDISAKEGLALFK